MNQHHLAARLARAEAVIAATRAYVEYCMAPTAESRSRALFAAMWRALLDYDAAPTPLDLAALLAEAEAEMAAHAPGDEDDLPL